MAELEKTINCGGSEAVYDFYCEQCNEEGLHVEAEGFCNDCGEYLCGQCIVHHQKTRLTRYHKVLDKDNMPRNTPPRSDKVRLDICTTCQQHKGKLLEFYCKSHDTLVCSLCFAEGHRLCRDIKTIIEVSQSLFDSNEYKDFKQSLECLAQQSRDMIIESRDNLVKSEVCFSEAIVALQIFRKEINSLIDKLEISLLAEIEGYKADIKEKSESLARTCTTLQETIDKLTSEFESLSSSNHACQTYIRMKETTTDIKDIECQLKQVREDITVKSLTFVPNEDLRKLLSGPDSFGQLSVQDNRGQNTTPVIQTVSSASFIQDINVTSANDRYWITGSAVLSESKLVIVDHTNNKVKLVDTHSMKVISESDCLYPIDITVIKEDQVAVTSLVYDKILFLKVTDSIIKEREIEVNGNGKGIAYSKNQLLVTYETPPKLEIMDLQGNVISIIENDKDSNKLFKRPIYVCASSGGNMLYVSDSKANSVVSLSRDGAVKAIYSDSNLNYPTKVCLDHRGNIFVCGRFSKNVHMLTPECIKIKEILTEADGLTYDVWSVSHCRQTDRLYIGMDGFNRIKVYKLT